MNLSEKSAPRLHRLHTLLRTGRQRWLLGILLVLLIIGGFLYQYYASGSADRQVKQAVTGSAGDIELITKGQVNMAGAHLENDGLHVEPIPFAIVNQDGSGGQSNPPVNLYGTHLETKNDFVIGARLKQLKAKALLSFYGEVPTIYDEFRFERNTLELTLEGNKLTVKAWRKGNQTPQTASFAIAAGTDRDVTLAKNGNKLLVYINDKRVTELPNDGLFDSGRVWYGAGAETQPWVLQKLTVYRSGQPVSKLVKGTDTPIAPDSQGLQYLLNQKNTQPGFTIGAAGALAPAVSDPQYASILFGGNFGSITTENALKWQFIHPAKQTYDFHESDALVNLAQKHHLKVHGHPLVFGEAYPAWVQQLPTSTAEDKAAVQKVMTDHIATVMRHFAGKIDSYDVVNEPLADYDQFEQGHHLRNSVWSRAMGEAYITTAFQTARAADPDAKLVINEFGLEAEGDRWDYFFDLVSRLKAQGAPIDTVGFQSHVYERGDRIPLSDLQNHINQLAEIGIESRISEIDVYSEDGTGVQAEEYASVLKTCLQNPSCISYTTWGVSDRYNMFKDDDGNLQYGRDFLWDTNMQPTPAVAALRAIVGE